MPIQLHKLAGLLVVPSAYATRPPHDRASWNWGSLEGGRRRERETEAAVHQCETAVFGSPCFKAVAFARSSGIYDRPEVYSGLSATASFEDFQKFFYDHGTHGCQKPPCPENQNPGFACESDITHKKIVTPVAKGMCLDDTTFHWCHTNILSVWPNTQQPIKSLRTFNAWQPHWADTNRQAGHADLVRHVKRHGVKIFVGTPATCNQANDDLDWSRTKEFMRQVGVENIMGVSIGNELDLLQFQEFVNHEKGCSNKMWNEAGYWKLTQARISDLDAMGPDWAKLPVSAVWSPAAPAITPAGTAFTEIGSSRVDSFLRNASKAYGKRWVFAHNVYTYWDPIASMNFPMFWRCDKAIHRRTCWDHSKDCYITEEFSKLRKKIKRITGNDDDTFWITEIGWSAPGTTKAISLAMKLCSEYTSNRTLAKIYDGFLKYDMNTKLRTGLKGPDHMFYFSMRDGNWYDHEEHFGLVDPGLDPAKACEPRRCKLHAKDFEAHDEPVDSANGGKWVLTLVVVALLALWFGSASGRSSAGLAVAQSARLQVLGM